FKIPETRLLTTRRLTKLWTTLSPSRSSPRHASKSCERGGFWSILCLDCHDRDQQMSMQLSSKIVQKVWSCAHVLKDDGLAFMDYTEQITYLLFLKMAWGQRKTGAAEIP